MDLLLGNGKYRYMCTHSQQKQPASVHIRGFSAGSFSGLCLCHLFWRQSHLTVSGKLGGIALPPLLLAQIPQAHGENLLLFHYVKDSLCQWNPSTHFLSGLKCQYCVVRCHDAELQGHFGHSEHNYGHWLELPLPVGDHELWHLLRQIPEIALPARRDAAPLRLISWLSWKLPTLMEKLLLTLMELFAAVAPVASDEVFAVSCEALQLDPSLTTSWDQIRDAIIRNLVVGGNTPAPQAVTGLLGNFLQRLPLPRLVHFLDMILPQLVPVKSPSRTQSRRFSSSYLVEELNRANGHQTTFDFKVCHLFWSRAGMAHFTIEWRDTPILLMATHLIEGKTTGSFQWEKGAAYDRQQIQMGLRKGNTVLVHFRRGTALFQAVMLTHDADLKTGKVHREQHKYWRYVAPTRTYFDWLPEEVAMTFCCPALATFPDRTYGTIENLEVQATARYQTMTFENVYYIGDAKSGQELEVFLKMRPERLRLGCGLQCTEPMSPLGPNHRPKLYAAAVKLLRFVVGLDYVPVQNDVEQALRTAVRPLLQLPDEHVLATISAVVLALREGRTGLSISGVFGAGKTRSAAVLLAGLLVFEPDLKLMVVTKENVAAHAFAEHLVALQLPQELQQLMGRLVGYYEQKRKSAGTAIDIPVENRNHHIKNKSLLIGCGGGFLQECGQPYSPVADWIAQADIVLEDEGQQYGNMEESSTIARTPRTCLEIWPGDHRQTRAVSNKRLMPKNLDGRCSNAHCPQRRIPLCSTTWSGGHRCTLC